MQVLKLSINLESVVNLLTLLLVILAEGFSVIKGKMTELDSFPYSYSNHAQSLLNH